MAWLDSRLNCLLSAVLRSSTASSPQTNILLGSGRTELGARAPREKDGGGEAVTFRRPWTRMDEPGCHFFGVKRPSGCQDNSAPLERPLRRTTHAPQRPPRRGGTSATAVETDLKHPEANPIVVHRGA